MKRLIIILTIALAGCQTLNRMHTDLQTSKDKVMLKKEGPEEFFYWELKEDNSLWDLDIGNVPELFKYRDTLNLVLGTSVYKTAISKQSKQNMDTALLEQELDGDKINNLLVHSGSVGNIRKINFLESQILNYQMNRFPMFSFPTEFHVFITHNRKEEKIRVYFGASDTEWPPHPTIILDELKMDENKGWKLKYHLHNHYCKKEENYVGILAPSLADAQYYKMLKEKFRLEIALITNGFHTVQIKNEDFEKFESH